MPPPITTCKISRLPLVGYSAHPRFGTVRVANGCIYGCRKGWQRHTSSTALPLPLHCRPVRFHKAESIVPSGEVDTSPMLLSASGSQAGTGILWAPIAELGGQIPGVMGVLHALDASNLSTDLWNSELNSNRDRAGNFAKFNPPTVANGKICQRSPVR